MSRELEINQIIKEYLKTKDNKLRDKIIFLWEIKLKNYIETYYSDYYDKESLYYHGLFEGIQAIDKYNENYSVTLNTILNNILKIRLEKYIESNKKPIDYIIKEKSLSERELEDYVGQKMYLEEILPLLKKNHREIFLLHLQGYNSYDIAQIYHCSHQNIRQIIKTIQENIRYPYKLQAQKRRMEIKNKLTEEKRILQEERQRKLKLKEEKKKKQLEKELNEVLNLKTLEEEEHQNICKLVRKSPIIHKSALINILKNFKSEKIYNFLNDYFSYYDTLIILTMIFYDTLASELLDVLKLNKNDYKEKLIKALTILEKTEYKTICLVKEKINKYLVKKEDEKENLSNSSDNKALKKSNYIENTYPCRIHEILQDYYPLEITFLLSYLICDIDGYHKLKTAFKESIVQEAESKLGEALIIIYKEKNKNINILKLDQKL